MRSSVAACSAMSFGRSAIARSIEGLRCDAGLGMSRGHVNVGASGGTFSVIQRSLPFAAFSAASGWVST